MRKCWLYMCICLGALLAACSWIVSAPAPISPASTARKPIEQSAAPTDSPVPSPTSSAPNAQPPTIAVGTIGPPAGTPNAAPPLPLELAEATLLYPGQELPAPAGVISAGSLNRLARVAQWGRGIIVDLLFTPDGRSFAVGTNYGVAIYALADPAGQPRWVPFPERFAYQRFDFSADGRFLLLRGWDSERVLRLEDARFVSRDPATSFLFSMNPSADDQQAVLEVNARVKVLSPDGRLIYRGDFMPEKLYDRASGTWYQGTTALPLSEIYDAATGALLVTFPDQLPVLHYQEWMPPDGCDLRYFNPDGNAFQDSGYMPYRAAFAPDSETIGVLYLSETHRFRILRFYRTADGALLSAIGSQSESVEDFAYGPDNRTVLVGFMDGTIRLLDLSSQGTLFSGQHFSSHLIDARYSFDGKYLVTNLTYEGVLEVRSARDGSVAWRGDATAYDVSRVENLVAVGSQVGAIDLRDIASGRVVRELRGHTAKITALAFSPGGERLVSSAEDCSVRLWDTGEGKFLRFFEETWGPSLLGVMEPSRIFIYSLQVLQSRERVFGLGSWGVIVNWDIHSGQRLFQVQTDEQSFRAGIRTASGFDLRSFQIDEAGSQFFDGDYRYDLDTGQLAGTLESAAPPEEGSLRCDEYDATQAVGGLSFALVTGRRDGWLCVLEGPSRSPVGAIEVLSEPLWILRPPLLSPDGKQLSVPAYDGVIYVYQVLP